MGLCPVSQARPEVGAKPVVLTTAKVVHIDRDEPNRKLLDDTLREIGFRHLAACDSIGQFAVLLGIENPDLVFLDIDAHPDSAYQTIRGIRDGEIGEDPFVVIVAMTSRPDVESVEAALGAGADDMVVKPISSLALQQRIVTQIDSRKEFIATDDYLGPDRRAEIRDLDESDLLSIVVPNGLRFAATGDAAAAPSDDRIQETLQSLSIQKFYHLSQKIARISGQQRDLMDRSKKAVDSAWAVQEISEALVDIDALIGQQDFHSVTQIVTSARQALADIQACGENATPKNFDLLSAHGHSIGAVLKESAETAGALVSALERAVSVIGAEPSAPAAEPAAAAPEAPSEPSSSADSEPSPESAGSGAPASFKVRLRAWWNGVDPQELEAAEQIEASAE
jgi:DNA-binding response OmpR family regulator